MTQPPGNAAPAGGGAPAAAPAADGAAAAGPAATATPDGSSLKFPDPPCFLDDSGAVELRLPSEKHLEAHWNATIFDNDDKLPATIMSSKLGFRVCFRVELEGRLWCCIAGEWCFDIGFTPIGAGTGFNLSSLVGDIHIIGWTGCDGHCIELCLYVPADKMPVGSCGTLYEVGARVALLCCNKSEGPILVGYQDLHEIEFY